MAGTPRTAWEREINVRARGMDVLKTGARSGTPSKENVMHLRRHFTRLPMPLLPHPDCKPFQHTHDTPFLTMPKKSWCPVSIKNCGFTQLDNRASSSAWTPQGDCDVRDDSLNTRSPVPTMGSRNLTHEESLKEAAHHIGANSEDSHCY